MKYINKKPTLLSGWVKTALRTLGAQLNAVYGWLRICFTAQEKIERKPNGEKKEHQKVSTKRDLMSPKVKNDGAEVKAGSLAPSKCLENGAKEKNGSFFLDLVKPKKDIEATPFILDFLIAAGLVILAAAPSAGKTTALVALAMRIAGFICDDFEPSIKRMVVIFTEHSTQIEEIIAAMIAAGVVKFDYETVRSKIILVNATRMSVDTIESCTKCIDECSFTYSNVRGDKYYSAKPLVIFDTTNANLDLLNENDSQAVGDMMAKLKSEFFVKRQIPVLLAGHTAKALKYGGSSSLSARGSGAFEGDAHQVVYITTDSNTQHRYLEIGGLKKRFHSSADAIKLVSDFEIISATDPFGDEITYPVTYVSQLEAVTKDQKQASKKNAKDATALQRESDLRGDILDLLEGWETLSAAGLDATLPTQEAICGTVGGNKAKVIDAFKALVKEGHILTVSITSPMKEKYSRIFEKDIHHNIKKVFWKKSRKDNFFD